MPAGCPFNTPAKLLELEIKDLLMKHGDPTVISGVWVDFVDSRREAVWIPGPELLEEKPSLDVLMKHAQSPAQTPRERAAALYSYANRARLRKF